MTSHHSKHLLFVALLESMIEDDGPADVKEVKTK
jgi:hypothetical protein